MRRFSRSAAISLLAATGALLSMAIAAPAANAIVRTDTGKKCTIVGTKGNDVLRGTGRKDVICGRGGNDKIYGRGGNDTIDGGKGNDKIYGENGKDTVHGGAGSDVVVGGSGNDKIFGQSGNDVVDGGTGNDVVQGQDGNDDLTGGAGADKIDGGSGFNVCDVVGAGDSQTKCALDKEAPKMIDIKLSKTVIDVSEKAQTFTITLRASDDTGIKLIQPGQGHLISGDARNGVWRVTRTVPRTATPGSHPISYHLEDRVGRKVMDEFRNAYTVINRNPDRELPVLRSFKLNTSKVDVQRKAVTITATARITDDLAGASDVTYCPTFSRRNATPKYETILGCMSMYRTSGSETDGIWEVKFTFPKGAPTGTWDSEISISDAASYTPTYWFGPGSWPARIQWEGLEQRQIPGGVGALSVVGQPIDRTAPTLKSFKLSKSTVDTSKGAVRVTATIAASDDRGVNSASLYIGGTPENAASNDSGDKVDIVLYAEAELVRGTEKDGVWEYSFVVPGGTPDGSYNVLVRLGDTYNFADWSSFDHAKPGEQLNQSNAPGSIRFVVANHY